MRQHPQMNGAAQPSDPLDPVDVTVPLRFMTEFGHESLRWPPHLEHAEIVRRLVAIRESGPHYRDGLEELARLLEGIERRPAAQIATSVLEALAWTHDNQGYGFLAKQLQILALNFKNLEPRPALE